MFSTNYNDILQHIENIDPIKYAKSRNYIDGSVTKLSPYISRGVISTKQVAISLFKRGYKPYQIENILKELAWRDYFQQAWIALGEDINKDVKQEQQKVSNRNISLAITQGNTRIQGIDEGIDELLNKGYMHNHVRMYVASLSCNIGKSHWLMPAQWMYYHLLDADWASNALSWQWVAGSFSSKKYYANQENINKFCYTNQRNTYLDISYENIEDIDTPELLTKLAYTFFETDLPENSTLKVEDGLPNYIYNFYNLDSNWDKDVNANRILLLEPSFFKKYPVCNRTINFILSLANNIQGIQTFVGEFDELKKYINSETIFYKEHPTTKHYKGIQHSRDWMFDKVNGYSPSFFSYWKKCEKYLHQLQDQALV
jgi:deoxyribodipyrimidine photo-lyase